MSFESRPKFILPDYTHQNNSIGIFVAKTLLFSPVILTSK